MLRAWRNADRFEGRSSVRSWLYRIATNVCIDMHRHVQRRARPMELGPASPPDESPPRAAAARGHWVTPLPDAAVAARAGRPGRDRRVPRVGPARLRHRAPAPPGPPAGGADPVRGAALAGGRGGRAARHERGGGQQRAAAGAGHARARCPAEADQGRSTRPTPSCSSATWTPSSATTSSGWSTLLHEDAVQSMPPFAMWLRGAADIGRWMVEPGPSACRGSRLLPTSANGCPAFGQYRPDPAGGYAPWALQVLEISGGQDHRHDVLPRSGPRAALPRSSACRSTSTRKLFQSTAEAGRLDASGAATSAGRPVRSSSARSLVESSVSTRRPPRRLASHATLRATIVHRPRYRDHPGLSREGRQLQISAGPIACRSGTAQFDFGHHRDGRGQGRDRASER